jgi:hypothetical protein
VPVKVGLSWGAYIDDALAVVKYVSAAVDDNKYKPTNESSISIIQPLPMSIAFD